MSLERAAFIEENNCFGLTSAYFVFLGMTCTGCQAKMNYLLSQVKGVTAVDIDLTKGEAAMTMEKHIPTSEFQQAIKEYPKYHFSEIESQGCMILLQNVGMAMDTCMHF